MLINYLKIAFRNLVRHRSFTLINILGLAVGMACCILIMIWVVDELNFDKFHLRSADLYRMMTKTKYTDTTKEFAGTPAPLSEAMKDDFPEIEAVSRLGGAGQSLVKFGDNSYYEDGFVFVDPDFLKIFTFPMLSGDIDNALTEPMSVILTKEMSEKYFGDVVPLGKYLNVEGEDFLVSGVIKNIPENSHIRFDFILPFQLVESSGGSVHWGAHAYLTYVLLNEGASYQNINEMMPEWTVEHTAEPVSYYLQPVTDIHLYYEGGILHVYIFSAIAVFVLLIAIMNFINMSTAKSSTRLKEVGLRKVIGAGRIDIVKQFVSEYFVLAFFATIIALILVEVSMPGFNRLSGKNLDFGIFSNTYFLLAFAGILLLTGVLSITYPSLYLSSFLPVKILKGGSKTVGSKARLRKILVVGQFTLSIILINSTFIVYKQLEFTRNRNLGFNKDLLVCIPVRGDLQQKYSVFKNELLNQPGIKDVTAGSGMPSGRVDAEWGQIH